MARLAHSQLAPLVPPPDGLHLLGGYRLLRLLGQGGMSEVYLGYDGQAGFPVAVKVLAANLAQDQIQVDRFEREAKLSTRLNHVNIVRGLDSGLDTPTGRRYLVMEYIDGPSAQAVLDQQGRMDVADAVHVALAMGHALEHLHARHFVHRDIKPANILLAPDGAAKLTDLGLVKWNDKSQSQLTANWAGFGTSNYMPHEQALNAHFVDGRSDIFALGATLYHLLTGRVPFPGDDHNEIMRMKAAGHFTPTRLLNPKIPESLAAILHTMLAKDPRQRFQSASELIVALERTGLATGLPSYADLGQLRLEPTVAHSTEPTRPDLRMVQPAGANETNLPTIWYLSYKGRLGEFRLRRATTDQVLAAVRSGKLGGKVLASRQRDRHFRPLTDFPEFHVLLDSLSLTTRTSTRPRRLSWCRRLMTGLGLAAVLCCLTAAVVCRILVQS